MQNHAHVSASEAVLSEDRNTEVEVFDPSPAAIGARLALIRLESCLTQADFARRLGVSLRSYHHYEKGDRSLSHENLAILSTEFGADLNWLILGAEVATGSSEESAMHEFHSSLNRYLEERQIRLLPAQKRAIIAAWYQGRRRKRQPLQDEVAFWIEMLR